MACLKHAIIVLCGIDIFEFNTTLYYISAMAIQELHHLT